jgi:hypothetical protein
MRTNVNEIRLSALWFDGRVRLVNNGVTRSLTSWQLVLKLFPLVTNSAAAKVGRWLCRGRSS